MLQALRDELDGLDKTLLETLRQRLDCCCRIGLHKRDHAIPMMQPHRIGVVQARAAALAAQHRMSPTFLRALYELIITETCRLEDEIIGRGALDRYLAQRRLPVTRTRWDPKTALVPGLEEDTHGITVSRLWAVMRRFFLHAAQALASVSPSTADKLKHATPHWMRHTHATHALARGVELTTVRDNLRHASVATASVYLHTDEVKRAQQMGEAFPARHHA